MGKDFLKEDWILVSGYWYELNVKLDVKFSMQNVYFFFKPMIPYRFLRSLQIFPLPPYSPIPHTPGHASVSLRPSPSIWAALVGHIDLGSARWPLDVMVIGDAPRRHIIPHNGVGRLGWDGNGIL